MLKGGGEVAPRHKKYSGIINFEPIPTGRPTHNFIECSRERASEIVKSIDGEILVSFSGGADCTLAAISVIEAGAAERLTIGMSRTAIEHTHNSVIDHFVESGCRLVKINGSTLKERVESGVRVLTGCQGDTILCSDYVHRAKMLDGLHDLGVEEAFAQLSGRPDAAKLLEMCSWFFDEMPGHIERTAANMIWWLEFCGDWHLNNFNVTSHVNIGQPGVTHHHFFDSTPFQRWSVQDSRQKVGNTAATHKEQIYRACEEMSGKKLTIPVKTEGWGDLFFDNENPNYRNSIVAIHDDWRIVTK